MNPQSTCVREWVRKGCLMKNEQMLNKPSSSTIRSSIINITNPKRFPSFRTPLTLATVRQHLHPLKAEPCMRMDLYIFFKVEYVFGLLFLILLYSILLFSITKVKTWKDEFKDVECSWTSISRSPASGDLQKSLQMMEWEADAFVCLVRCALH